MFAPLTSCTLTKCKFYVEKSHVTDFSKLFPQKLLIFQGSNRKLHSVIYDSVINDIIHC